MCTHNGAAHLIEQLDSIHSQNIDHIDIWVSDDGSSDNTLEILNDYKQGWNKGKFEIRSGPEQGYAINFLSLACRHEVQADFYAFSDQDDIWHHDKLSHAMRLLPANDEMPALYCSRTLLIDENSQSLNRLSPLFAKTPSFQNALVQSIAGGNTMVFNRNARELLLQAGLVNIISHDWWTYLLVSGAGGRILYDEKPKVEYRQHSGNQVGANTSFPARIFRIKKLLKGEFREWSQVNVNNLLINQSLLEPENQRILVHFSQSRVTSIFKRVMFFNKSGVYRQTTAGTLGPVDLWWLNIEQHGNSV